MKFISPIVFILSLLSLAQAEVCQEEQSKAKDEYNNNLNALLKLKFIKKNGEEVSSKRLAEDFYSDLSYFSRNVALSLSPQESFKFKENAFVALLDPVIAKKVTQSAAVLDLKLTKTKDGHFSICSEDISNSALTINFCDKFLLPQMKAEKENWADDHYIVGVFNVVKDKKGKKAGKIYNGIDYSLNESQFVNLKSKEACASKIVDSKRDQLSASEDQGSVILNTPKDLKK